MSPPTERDASQGHTKLILVLEDTRPNLNANEKTTATEQNGAPPNFAAGKSWRFWAIFPSLMVTTLLSAVEVTGAFLLPSSILL